MSSLESFLFQALFLMSSSLMTPKIISPAQASLQIPGVYIQLPTQQLHSHLTFTRYLLSTYLCAKHRSGLWE